MGSSSSRSNNGGRRGTSRGIHQPKATRRSLRRRQSSRRVVCPWCRTHLQVPSTWQPGQRLICRTCCNDVYCICEACNAQVMPPPGARMFRCPGQSGRPCGHVIDMHETINRQNVSQRNAGQASSGGHSSAGGGGRRNLSAANSNSSRSPHSSQNNQQPPVPPSDPIYIRCPRCNTLLRAPPGHNQFRCQPCGTLLVLGWSCQFCEAVNHEHQSVCTMCAQPRNGNKLLDVDISKLASHLDKHVNPHSMQNWTKSVGSDGRTMWVQIAEEGTGGAGSKGKNIPSVLGSTLANGGSGGGGRSGDSMIGKAMISETDVDISNDTLRRMSVTELKRRASLLNVQNNFRSNNDKVKESKKGGGGSVEKVKEKKKNVDSKSDGKSSSDSETKDEDQFKDILMKQDLVDMVLRLLSNLENGVVSVGQLRSILDHLGVDHSQCIEKVELVRKIKFVLFSDKPEAKEVLQTFKHRRVRSKLAHMAWVRSSPYTCDPVRGISLIPVQNYVALRGEMNVPGIKETELDLNRISRLPFSKKLAFFRQKCHKTKTEGGLRVAWSRETHQKLSVRRNFLIEDSLQHFLAIQRRAKTQKKPDIFRQIFRYTFKNEEALDAGGVAREWFELVSTQLFNADLGYFCYSQNDNLTYTINPKSELVCGDNHLMYFTFAGMFVAKALFDGHNIAAHLTVPILKHILGAPVGVRDLNYSDPTLAESLQKLLDVDDSQVSDLYLDFTVSDSADMIGGGTQSVELKPGGADIDVTASNRIEYVELIVKHKLCNQIAPQLTKFLQGFYSVMPLGLISIFTFYELELLMCGLPSIDCDDWKYNTNIKYLKEDALGNFSRKVQERVVEWFWDVVLNELDNEQRAKLLQFCTGTSRVPVAGFAVLQSSDGKIRKFTIALTPLTKAILPTSHTCFNLIKLPLYKSKKDLSENLLKALELSGGFGFGME